MVIIGNTQGVIYLGLWTAIYLASQCYRYAVTKDPEVKSVSYL
jgi:hypothetical protein